MFGVEAESVSVVVPTYNERERLEPLVAGVFDALGARGLRGEMVVVDDSSPDGTGALAEALAERFPLRVVHRPGKLGLGGAVMAGFEAATGGLLAVMDGDLSHPPAVVPDLVAAVRVLGVDMAVGSRYIPGGAWRNWPRRRLLMSRAACLMARPLTPVRDAMSGLFVVRREAVEGVRIASAGFKICLELQLRSRVRSVAEVPYTFVDRRAGRSKMSAGEAFHYLAQLGMLSQLRLAARAPRLQYSRVAPGQLEALRRA
ncbi:MAG: dolichol monophosphate mannose synthase [Acidobacteria bacterium]|nr:dolichol monophosphate mannose synthase [Acidobacteriota bacterium]